MSNVIAFSQKKQVQNYKYIIVPERFDFLKENDQYKTSSLTKFLLQKNGFTVILDSEEYPIELKNNPCNALTANVTNKSSMFKTKVVIELKDCYNKTVYASKEGESRLKEYKRSYQEAIRNAHANMNSITYEALSGEDIIQTKKEVIVSKPMIVNRVDKIIPSINKEIESTKNKATNTLSVLYAQPKENGYQLINLKPEVVFLILNTNIQDVYIIKNKNGLLYKKEAHWIAEFYENEKLVTKKYQIKF